MGGIRISWYDLEPAQRDGYLSWLHERYLSALLKRPGIEWAAHYLAERRSPPKRLTNTDDVSVPGGGDYILLVGAATPHVFAPPHPRETFAPVAENEAAMLALRRNERVSIMVEEARVNGPEAANHELGPCIQLGSFNATPENENELLSWYARWRLPCMEKLPGCVRTRKLSGVVGWSKHGVLYEFTSLEARDKYFPTHEKPYPELEAWTDEVVRRLLHAPRSPQVAQRIWPR
jgi:hypothetical protein